VCFTTGSMEGCCKIFEMIIEKGEPLMLQSPTYTGIIGSVNHHRPLLSIINYPSTIISPDQRCLMSAQVVPMQSDLITIPMDDDGVLPYNIIKVCEERRKSNRPLPKVRPRFRLQQCFIRGDVFRMFPSSSSSSTCSSSSLCLCILSRIKNLRGQ
jgi:DNA-binding transcriptional MocR family regulator